MSRLGLDPGHQRVLLLFQLAHHVHQLSGELEGVRGDDPVVVVGGGQQNGGVGAAAGRRRPDVVEGRVLVDVVEVFLFVGVAKVGAPRVPDGELVKPAIFAILHFGPHDAYDRHF